MEQVAHTARTRIESLSFVRMLAELWSATTSRTHVRQHQEALSSTQTKSTPTTTAEFNIRLGKPTQEDDPKRQTWSGDPADRSQDI